eukprot:s676_g9.t1
MLVNMVLNLSWKMRTSVQSRVTHVNIHLKMKMMKSQHQRQVGHVGHWSVLQKFHMVINRCQKKCLLEKSVQQVKCVFQFLCGKELKLQKLKLPKDLNMAQKKAKQSLSGFDPDAEVAEPSPKQPRTALYSPVYAGEISGSPATSSTSRHVRRVVEEVELYDEDELECGATADAWEWELSEKELNVACEKSAIPGEEQKRKGFFNEGLGPPEITEDEMSWLDQVAMQAELERLRHLDVIADVDETLEMDNCMKLDTRLVRDWRFRDGRWRRRARLVAREFRDGDASSAETFSPTTPLAVVKLLVVMSLLHNLALASLDVGDAFLQVPQSSIVLIEIPQWALPEGRVGSGKRFWVLKKCLPGQRVAASEWNKFFTDVCERRNFESFQGTIFRH